MSDGKWDVRDRSGRKIGEIRPSRDYTPQIESGVMWIIGVLMAILAIQAVMRGIGSAVNPTDPGKGLAIIFMLGIGGLVTYFASRIYLFEYESIPGRIVGVLLGSALLTLCTYVITVICVMFVAALPRSSNVPDGNTINAIKTLVTVSLAAQFLGLAIAKFWRSQSGMQLGLLLFGAGAFAVLVMMVAFR